MSDKKPIPIIWLPDGMGVGINDEQPKRDEDVLVDGGLGRIGVDTYLTCVKYSVRPKKVIFTINHQLGDLVMLVMLVQPNKAPKPSGIKWDAVYEKIINTSENYQYYGEHKSSLGEDKRKLKVKPYDKIKEE